MDSVTNPPISSVAENLAPRLPRQGSFWMRVGEDRDRPAAKRARGIRAVVRRLSTNKELGSLPNCRTLWGQRIASWHLALASIDVQISGLQFFRDAFTRSVSCVRHPVAISIIHAIVAIHMRIGMALSFQQNNAA
jgi:hypothetical protein